MRTAIDLAERGYVPDFVTRVGIRRLLASRLSEERRRHADGRDKRHVIETMGQGPLALGTDDANDQHYEVPAEFFQLMLGERLKYSCALFDEGAATLDQAEEDMLGLTCDRARIRNGMSILELGCGWGSLTLYLAARFPDSPITAVSNSASQREYILARAEETGATNVRVVTADMNDFDTGERFDRIVSVEMFEHMRNYKLLFDRIAGWLAADGKLFFHIFCHREMPWFFTIDSDKDWMARHFFTGGVMPSWDLPCFFQDRLVLKRRWSVDGLNYAKTCEAWLSNLDRNKAPAIRALSRSENPSPPEIQFNRWRMFVMACRELFGWRGGREWHVGHYLFEPRR